MDNFFKLSFFKLSGATRSYSPNCSTNFYPIGCAFINCNHVVEIHKYHSEDDESGFKKVLTDVNGYIYYCTNIEVVSGTGVLAP